MICQQIEFIYLILIVYLFITIELSHSSCMPWGISPWRHCDPFDCQWGPWKSFTKCSKSCGIGKQTRSRSKSIIERNGGKCLGSPNETKSCNNQNCPTKCKWKGKRCVKVWKRKGKRNKKIFCNPKNCPSI